MDKELDKVTESILSHVCHVSAPIHEALRVWLCQKLDSISWLCMNFIMVEVLAQVLW